jgi:hypothetical protein
LSKLGEHLVATGVVASISRETVRQILRAGGVSWQATKTWKVSTDPGFITKMGRVLDLYDHPPADGRVICADEFGPLNLQPRPGRAPGPPLKAARTRVLIVSRAWYGCLTVLTRNGVRTGTSEGPAGSP